MVLAFKLPAPHRLDEDNIMHDVVDPPPPYPFVLGGLLIDNQLAPKPTGRLLYAKAGAACTRRLSIRLRT